MACFEGLEFAAIALGQRDVVESFEQAPFSERVNLEEMRLSVGAGYDLLLQIYFDRRADLRVKLKANL
jgi:hypothetical protein